MENGRFIGEYELFSTHQDLLNRIHGKALSIPLWDLKTDKSGKVKEKGFTYHFKDGTTTQGFTDQISAKLDIENSNLTVFYAKGIHAGRVVFSGALGADVVVIASQVFRKDSHPKSQRGGYSFVPAANFLRERMVKPHYHAIESLIDDLSNKLQDNPGFLSDKYHVNKGESDDIWRQAHGKALAMILRKRSLKNQEKDMTHGKSINNLVKRINRHTS